MNGNMFMGLFGADIGVKLGEGDQDKLRRAGGGSFGPQQRPMRGYVTLPAGFARTKSKPWVTKSLDHVGSLPPKKAKPKKKP